MSTELLIGSEGNILEARVRRAATRYTLRHPILTGAQMARIKHVGHDGIFLSVVLPMVFDGTKGGRGPDRSPGGIYSPRRTRPSPEGVNILVLSDTGWWMRDHVPIPALLAVAGLHHHLIRARDPDQCGDRAGVGGAAPGASFLHAPGVRRDGRLPVSGV